MPFRDRYRPGYASVTDIARLMPLCDGYTPVVNTVNDDARVVNIVNVDVQVDEQCRYCLSLVSQPARVGRLPACYPIVSYSHVNDARRRVDKTRSSVTTTLRRVSFSSPTQAVSSL